MPSPSQITEAIRLVESGLSRRAAAAQVGMAESTLRYHLNGGGWSGRAKGELPPGITVTEDEAILVSPPSSKVTDPTQLMIEMGLDPAEWENPTAVVNRWGDPSDPSYQLKLRLQRRELRAFPTPAIHVPSVPFHSDRRSGDWRTTFILGDQQAPYHDPAAHKLVCEALAEMQPEFAVLTGDTVDFPTISRHKDNPEWHQPVQDCIDSGYRLIRDYVEASPSTKFFKLLGNHDERIRNELLLRAERMYGIKPAATPEQPEQEDALSIRRLLHLDTLGVELIEPNGGYQHAQHAITSKLVVRHGWLTGANAPDKSLRNVDFSLVVGHTHRQSITKRLVHSVDGKLTEQVAVETGCLCQIEGGLGYAVDPNWAQGFAVATVWDDGAFHVELATIKNTGSGYKELLLRDDRWLAAAHPPIEIKRGPECSQCGDDCECW